MKLCNVRLQILELYFLFPIEECKELISDGPEKGRVFSNLFLLSEEQITKELPFLLVWTEGNFLVFFYRNPRIQKKAWG